MVAFYLLLGYKCDVLSIGLILKLSIFVDIDLDSLISVFQKKLISFFCISSRIIKLYFINIFGDSPLRKPRSDCCYNSLGELHFLRSLVIYRLHHMQPKFFR